MDNPQVSDTRQAVRTWVGGGLLLFVLALLALTWHRAEASAGSDGGILGVSKSDTSVVSVELTPKKLEGGKLTVDMRVTTHTVYDLDKYDLTKIVTLEHDGMTVRPTSALKLHGHHNFGQVEFPMVTLPAAFTIRIDGLNKPGVRVFTWP